MTRRRRRRPEDHEGQERGRRQHRMEGGSQKGKKNVKQVEGKKVGGWGKSRKHVEDNVRSAPLIFRMKQTVCVKNRLEKEEMCTADMRGLAGMTWFGIYGLKHRRVWKGQNTLPEIKESTAE